MANVWQDRGRVNQKRRTRAAILTAAAELLRAGEAPTVEEAGAAAGVSRATAYRYFPSQELLLVEAALDAAVPDISSLLTQPEVAATPEDRLDVLVRAVHGMVNVNEAAFRTLLRLSVALQHAGTVGKGTEGDVRRGGRRVAWLEEALAPVTGNIGEPASRRLVASLSLFLGIETRVVLSDVCGLDAAEAESVARWATRALLRASIEEAGEPPG